MPNKIITATADTTTPEKKSHTEIHSAKKRPKIPAMANIINAKPNRQKTQAAMNVQNMKKAGEQLKKKVADKRQECLGVIETEEVVVAVPAGEAVNLTKMKANSKKAMKEMQQKGKSNATKQAKWLSQMDQNGDMLIEVAEFIDLNANQ